MNRVVGYATAVEGIIDVRTVSPTRQGAIVNWLVVKANVMVMQSFGREKIEELFAKHRQRFPTVEVFKVIIEPAELSEP